MAPEDGVKRGIAVWHRRAGKDSTAINLSATKAASQRVGTYWHLLPTSVQSRRVVWNETDSQGRRIIDQAFPPEIRESTNASDMTIRLLNGSLWQLGGSDHYNSLVGSNVIGVVFSEWALCDPAAWDYIRPILVENGGWALFIYTPRGRNHGWDLWRTAQQSERWFTSLLSIDDTAREDGSPIVSHEQVEDERRDGMSEEKAQQEFYCSFAAGVEGAYFARQLEVARNEDRIGKVPWNPRYPVHLYMDLGIDDATAIWFGQRIGTARLWFRYAEYRDRALADVFLELAELPYRYATINLPHDGKQRDKGTGRKLVEYAEDAWADQPAMVKAHPQRPKQDLIEGGRALIGVSYFDEEHCARGLDALSNYRKIWDEKRKCYQQQPLHDWASHGASAWELAGQLDDDEPAREFDVLGRKPRVHTQVRGSIRI